MTPPSEPDSGFVDGPWTDEEMADVERRSGENERNLAALEVRVSEEEKAVAEAEAMLARIGDAKQREAFEERLRALRGRFDALKRRLEEERKG